MITSPEQNDDVICLRKCDRLTFIFPTRWYGVWEIELSQLGKISRNQDLVCKKVQYTVGNQFLWLCSHVAIEINFRTDDIQCTSQNEI